MTVPAASVSNISFLARPITAIIASNLLVQRRALLLDLVLARKFEVGANLQLLAGVALGGILEAGDRLLGRQRLRLSVQSRSPIFLNSIATNAVSCFCRWKYLLDTLNLQLLGCVELSQRRASDWWRVVGRLGLLLDCPLGLVEALSERIRQVQIPKNLQQRRCECVREQLDAVVFHKAAEVAREVPERLTLARVSFLALELEHVVLELHSRYVLFYLLAQPSDRPLQSFQKDLNFLLVSLLGIRATFRRGLQRAPKVFGHGGVQAQPDKQQDCAGGQVPSLQDRELLGSGRARLPVNLEFPRFGLMLN